MIVIFSVDFTDVVSFVADAFDNTDNASLLLLLVVFTVRLHVMQRTVLLSQFCLSVRQMRV